MAPKKAARAAVRGKPHRSKASPRVKDSRVTRQSPGQNSENGTRRHESDVVIRKRGVCGGAPIIVGTRIPVWGLEAARRRGLADTTILKMYPALTSAKLRAAWQYVANHQDSIDAEIRDNERA
jgi:uncharacterized protein (DUF433 family)